MSNPGWRSRILSHWPFLLVLAAAAILFTIQLNRDILLDWDECVYSQQSVEMLESGNYITNRWNRALVFEKPPLYNWSTVPFYAAFGANSFTARIPMVLMGLVLIAAIYAFCVRFFSRRTAWLAVGMFLATDLSIRYIVRNNTDIGFAMFVFMALWVWFESYRRRGILLAVVSGLLFGLGVMTKGLGAIPYVAALFVTVFISFSKADLIRYIITGSVFVATILPWHLYHFITYGESFTRVYIMEHIIKRSQNTLDFHFHGRLFYIKLILTSFFPWIVTAITVPFAFWTGWRTHPGMKRFRSWLVGERVWISLMIVFLVVLISITRVKTRIEWYALPLYPILAIILAEGVSKTLLLIKNKRTAQGIFLTLTIAIFAHATYAATMKIRPWDGTRTTTPAYDMFMKISDQPEDEFRYLVWHGERKAEAILPQDMRTSTTFVYGGHPCAVRYTGKKVHYFYNIPAFQSELKTGSGLFLIENSDKDKLVGIPGDVVYENTDYTLFRKPRPAPSSNTDEAGAAL
jgi:4-amino-4-deoxy-L-arabinose transferase-like glycosyltransferase